MKKYPVALFIGRFQPFHNGHLYSLNKACGMAEKVIVGIGSSNESGTENNPWNYEERRRMIEGVIEKESLAKKIQAVWAIPDNPSDEEWARNIILSIQEEGFSLNEVIAIGNNDWVNGILKGKGITVMESGLYNRDELEGVKIRKMMRGGEKQWMARVPEVVKELLPNVSPIN